MCTVSEAVSRNRILTGLPLAERNTIEPLLEVTKVHLGEVLDRAGTAVPYLYFPVDAALSMMDAKDSRHTLDVALIGAEGCSGASIAQGSEVSPALNIVEIAGWTVRIPTSPLAERLPKLRYLSAALSRYNLLLMRQIVISVGCSQFHSEEQRIARWLLAHNHRAGLTVFPFTPDFLSAQVGLDADRVRTLLEDMQQRGLITKAPHSITICDQPTLAQQSCECFHLTKEATDGYVDAVTRLSRAYAH